MPHHRRAERKHCFGMGRGIVRITADTSVLLRAIVADDPARAATARALLLRATSIAVPVPVFCEFSWVLRRTYGYTTGDVAAAIEALTEIDAVVTDIPVTEAGLAALRAGGDFADGAIARQGELLGATVFTSFDRGAVARLRKEGTTAADPSELLAASPPGT